MIYATQLVAMIGIYLTATIAARLLLRETGLCSLSISSQMAIGGYMAAGFMQQLSVPLVVVIPVCCLLGGGIAAVLYAPIVRLSSDRAVLGTICIQLGVMAIVNNWTAVTNGAAGIRGVEDPSAVWLDVHPFVGTASLAIVTAMAGHFAVRAIMRRPIGVLFHAVRDDKILAQSLGSNSSAVVLLACTIAGGLASCAGALYVTLLSLAHPEMFPLSDSVLIIAIAVLPIGGGSLLGALLGPAVLVLFPELVHWAGVSSRTSGNLQQIVFGGILVVVAARRTGNARQ